MVFALIWLIVGVQRSFRDSTYTKATDYPLVRNALAAHPAIAHFPPAQTTLPAAARFTAVIRPMQAPDSVWLYMPGGTGTALPATAVVATDDQVLNEVQAALNALAPGRTVGSPNTEVWLLHQGVSSFSAVWVDSQASDQLFVAWLD